LTRGPNGIVNEWLQSNSDKVSKSLESQLSELNSKLDQAQREMTELNSSKARAQAEATDLGRKLEEAESQLNQFNKAKQALGKSLEEVKGNLEEETRVRQKLQSETRNLHADLDQLRESLEEEQSARSDMQRVIQKVNAECQTWKHKVESGEGGVRSEEMDDLKKKLNAKLAEAESQMEAAQSKAASLDKHNNRLKGELEDLTIEVERVSILRRFIWKRLSFVASLFVQSWSARMIYIWL
jgi:chromosome segregation ATPase